MNTRRTVHGFGDGSLLAIGYLTSHHVQVLADWSKQPASIAQRAGYEHRLHPRIGLAAVSPGREHALTTRADVSSAKLWRFQRRIVFRFHRH